MSAGKGDKPRNCFSKAFRDNYDDLYFDKYIKGLSQRLYENGWYAQADRIIEKCKNKEECKQYILLHCGEEYLKLL